MALTITIPGAVETTTGSTAPAVLTVGVGSPGPGVPSGGSTGQYLVKASGVSYDTAWLTLPADYITSVTAPLAVTTGNLTVDLSAYLPVSGGALDVSGTITASTATVNSLFAGDTFGVELTANPSENASLQYNGVQVQNAIGSMLVTASGLTFPNLSTQSIAFPGFNNTALTGNPTAPTPATSDDDTSIATTAYVKAQPFGDRYLTSSTTSNTIGNGNKTFTIGTGLSYTPTQSITIAYDAANHMHGEVLTYNSGTGVLTVDINHHTGSGTYTAWTVNVAGVVPVTSVAFADITGAVSGNANLQAALDLKANLASPALTGNVTITSNSAGAALFIEQSGAGNILTLHDQASDTNFVAIDSNGKINTVIADATTAGLNVPHGVAPTSPVNGDIWTTTGGVFARINAGTTQLMNLGSTQTVSGSITFSNANQTLGNSTAAGTIAIGNGATVSGSTKTLNIATNGVSGSTTTMSVGPSAGASTIDIGPSVLTSTLGLGTGNNLTGATKTVNIGTNGTTGTTNINIGSTSGTTMTVNGGTTFTGANHTLGNSTVATTVNVASGATASTFTKAVNIGTAGLAGSTTNVIIGSTTGTSTTTLQGNVTATGLTLDLGNSTATSASYTIGGGATISGATKTVNIGTGGVAGSTTTVNIGSTLNTTNVNFSVTNGTISLGGNATAATPAVDTNTTALATTAYVVGQAAAATPLVDGTAAVGTSLRYARQDHVHPTDTSRAALASPTFTGTPLSTTAAVDTNTTQIATTAYVIGQGYSKLASPSFSGTPSLPTGTTAVTQTAGNNTTALATTAFVTAAVPAFGATADINEPLSTTKAASIANVRDMLLNPGFQLLYLGVGASGTALSGYYNSSGGRYKQYQNSATSGSYGQFTFDTTGSSIGYAGYTRGQSADVHNWTKKIWLSGRCLIGNWNSGGNGDANSIARINLGGKNAFSGGNLLFNLKGIGWNVAGGGSAVMNLQVSNGSTVTTVATSFTPTLRQAFDWTLYSDGSGNVTLYINDAQVATTSAGPTGTQNFGLYIEGVDAIGASTAFTLETFGTKIYHGT